MVEYIVNEHIMSAISLLSTEINAEGGKYFLKGCKWSENNNFRDTKYFFLRYVEEL